VFVVEIAVDSSGYRLDGRLMPPTRVADAIRRAQAGTSDPVVVVPHGLMPGGYAADLLYGALADALDQRVYASADPVDGYTGDLLGSGAFRQWPPWHALPADAGGRSLPVASPLAGAANGPPEGFHPSEDVPPTPAPHHAAGARPAAGGGAGAAATRAAPVPIRSEPIRSEPVPSPPAPAERSLLDPIGDDTPAGTTEAPAPWNRTAPTARTTAASWTPDPSPGALRLPPSDPAPAALDAATSPPPGAAARRRDAVIVVPPPPGPFIAALPRRVAAADLPVIDGSGWAGLTQDAPANGPAGAAAAADPQATTADPPTPTVPESRPPPAPATARLALADAYLEIPLDRPVPPRAPHDDAPDEADDPVWIHGRPWGPQERTRLRQAIRSRYDTHARTVARALAEAPGLIPTGQLGDLVSDLVAVCAYHVDDRASVNATLRGAGAGTDTGDRDLLVACGAAKGLGRLPAVLGPVFAASLAEGADYRPGDELVEPSFIDVHTRPSVADAPLEFGIWSVSARRLDGISEKQPPSAVFPPGSRFQVIAVDHARDGGGPTRVLMRDRADNRDLDPEATHSVAKRLRNAFERSAAAGATAGECPALDFAPGLDANGRRFTSPPDNFQPATRRVSA